MVISYPEEVKYIINTLKKHGFEGFLVGGSVRDSLLSIEPKDFDITTNALPEDVIQIFHKTIPTGIKHGTVTVIENSIPFEITTYRVDGEYKDNRRPHKIKFVSTLKEDLARRDFTINAFAYNEKYGLIDFFNGKKDLDLKLIHTVGDPDKRFQEDALRMLRAIRFSCQLGFDIEKNTFSAIKRNCPLILNISSERIRDEITKIITSPSPSRGIRLLNSSGILKLVLSDLHALIGFDERVSYHKKDLFEHTLSVMEKVPNSIHLRLASLLHDIGKPGCFALGSDGYGHFYNHENLSSEISKKILKKLRFDNNTIDKVSILIKEHMNILINPTDLSIKKLINRVGKDLIFDLYELQSADIFSSTVSNEFLEYLNYTENRTREILDSNVPLSIKDLKINGKILMEALGLNPGKKLGIILDYLMARVLDDPLLNNEKTLVMLGKEYYENSIQN